MSRILAGTRSEIMAAGHKVIDIDGRAEMGVGVYYVNGEFYAWRNVCPHRGAPICAGRVSGTHMPSNVYEYEYGKEQQVLRCPWHGWEFDLTTGEHMVECAGRPVRLRGYPVEIENDNVYVVIHKK